ncbi:UNVERIFIED_CONTAM: hypothetical protein FKN15_039872 [Acipenser sinensis]
MILLTSSKPGETCADSSDVFLFAAGRGRQPIDIRLSVMAVTRRALPIESITGAEALVENCGDGEPQKKKRATEQSISSSRGETLGSPGETCADSSDVFLFAAGRGRQPIDIRLSVMAVTRRALPIESITGAEALVENCGDGEPQKKKRATEQSISSSRGETFGSPVNKYIAG